MSSKRILWIGIALIALAAVGATLAFGKAEKPEAGGLTGAWMVTAQIESIPDIPPFSSPGAFTSDGLIINSNESGHIGIGVWTKIKGNTYSGTFTGVESYEGATIQYKIRATIELSQDEETFSGPFVNEVSMVGSNQPADTITGTISGIRMHVEPLD